MIVIFSRRFKMSYPLTLQVGEDVRHAVPSEVSALGPASEVAPAQAAAPHLAMELAAVIHPHQPQVVSSGVHMIHTQLQ